MAVPTLHGLNRSENEPHVLSCRNNADPSVKAKFLPLFLGTGNSLFAPLTWNPHVQTYQAVLKSSTPSVPTELTPSVMYNVLKHLQNVPSDSPCAGHTFYLDTATAHIVFCQTSLVPKNANTVDLMGKLMGISGYFLSEAVDATTGVTEGQSRLKALIKKTLDAIASVKPKAPAQPGSGPTPAPVLGASQGGQLTGVLRRVTGASAPDPLGTVAPTPRGGVGGPWGATSWADPEGMRCSF